ncbi:MAG: DUF262 domain-containing protein [Halomonas sp.]|uniref:DUF262 domain-containing protein n=1 Tax=Halomonas sp. TaxID=1486246 RepID=UPI002ACDA5CA|nr:DUF262 domain-containing protein [Halomonas sp.]MDZ7854177.1 DUF262 domain-containing protein [Halomonas sp.]
MNGQSFGAELMTLPEIFQDHFFVVPDYQRSYAWGEKQVGDLLEDLSHLLESRSGVRHYTGTMVLSRPEDQPDTFYVVDGQQRLTTLVILLRELCDRWEERCDHLLESFIYRGSIGNQRLVFTLNQDTHAFYEKYIINKQRLDESDITVSGHKRLLRAKKLIAGWLDEHIVDTESAKRVYNAVSERLGFIVYAPEETSETGIMFEVINNRGKELSELEKVKNYLIYCSVKLGARKLRNDIDQNWSNILHNLTQAKKTSPGEESAFLRYCLVVHYQVNKTDSQYGYDTIKKRLSIGRHLGKKKEQEALIRKIEKFVGFLEMASRWYVKLYAKDHRGLISGVRRQLDRIRAQARQASIMPIFIALVVKLGDDQEKLSRLLELVEKLNFRVYLARDIMSRNDSGQAYLYNCASGYYHGKLLAGFSEEERILGKSFIGSEEDALEYRLVEFSLGNSPDHLFEESLVLSQDENFDFFKWGSLRYFLMSYEEYLQENKTIPIDKILLTRKEGLSSDYLSVEHLWARRNRVDEGHNDRYKDWYQRRRLGNFVLLELRLNIQGRNDDIEDKVEHYLNGDNKEPPTDLFHVRKAARDIKKVLKDYEGRKRTKNFYYDLYDGINELQESRYRKFALKRWSLSEFLGSRKVTRQLSMEMA